MTAARRGPDARKGDPMKRLIVLLAVIAAALMAADINGTWKATAEGPNGSMERTFLFKVEGNKVTGETTS